MAKTILLIGAFDTKGPDYAFVRKKILSRGHNVLTVNTGVLGSTKLFPVGTLWTSISFFVDSIA